MASKNDKIFKKDEKLQDAYDRIVKGGNKNDTSHGNLVDILNLFKNLHILDTLKIKESDVETAFKSVSGTSSTINSEQFLAFLNQLSKTAKINKKKMEGTLIEILEYECLEKQFKDKLAEGKALLEDITAWISRNKITSTADLAKPEVAEVLNKVKDQAGIDSSEFSKIMERLAEQHKSKWCDLLKIFVGSGHRASTSDKQEKENS